MTPTSLSTCLGSGKSTCQGEVEFRTTPDRPDGKAFPRCALHFDERLASSTRNLELTSPTPARWFDPSYAGESWEED